MAYQLVLTTASSALEARKITEAILKNRLAACVTLLPSAESHFLWKGKKERARETVLLIKTQKRCYKKLEAAIKRVHSYEIPEIIALPISAGSSAYLKWIDASTA